MIVLCSATFFPFTPETPYFFLFKNSALRCVELAYAGCVLRALARDRPANRYPVRPSVESSSTSTNQPVPVTAEETGERWDTGAAVARQALRQDARVVETFAGTLNPLHVARQPRKQQMSQVLRVSLSTSLVEGTNTSQTQADRKQRQSRL